MIEGPLPMEESMSEPKILVLILAINKDPWRTIEIDGQDPTWKNLCPGNIQILRYIGGFQPNIYWRTLNKIWKINQIIQALTDGRFSPRFLNVAIQGKH